MIDLGTATFFFAVVHLHGPAVVCCEKFHGRGTNWLHLASHLSATRRCATASTWQSPLVGANPQLGGAVPQPYTTHEISCIEQSHWQCPLVASVGCRAKVLAISRRAPCNHVHKLCITLHRAASPPPSYLECPPPGPRPCPARFCSARGVHLLIISSSIASTQGRKEGKRRSKKESEGKSLTLWHRNSGPTHFFYKRLRISTCAFARLGQG